MYYYGNKITEDDKMKNISWAHKENARHPTKNILRKKWVFSVRQHSFLDLAMTKTAVLHLGSIDMFHGTLKLNGGEKNLLFH